MSHQWYLRAHFPQVHATFGATHAVKCVSIANTGSEFNCASSENVHSSIQTMQKQLVH